MSVIRSRPESEQIKEVKRFIKQLESSMLKAIDEGLSISCSQVEGTADVSDGTKYKKIATNGTFLYEINIGPFWTHHPEKRRS